MGRLAWVVLVPLCVGLAGCGRLRFPTRDRHANRPLLPTGAAVSSGLPKSPTWEAGPADAKVRVLAFLNIDVQHQAAQDAMRALVKQYPGKLYVKYVDPRTPEGKQIQQRAGSTGTGLLIDGQNSVELKTTPTRELNFGGEMYRFWTAEDLKEAVAQEVARAYGRTQRG